MSPTTLTAPPRRIIYPETDGQPMAENTAQYQAIVTVKENLELQFRDDPHVFIAADLFWYPEEGNNKLRVAPDTFVAFGAPKGKRGSYRQWEEGGIAPQVVFEALSPGNRFQEMLHKFHFYEQRGVEEYYIFNPEDGLWQGWIRKGGAFAVVAEMHGWVSPRLGVRFESVEGAELTLFHPNGERFLTTFELDTARREAEEQFQLERLARGQAQERANQAQERADQAEQRAERLAAQLRAAGIEPSQGQ